MLRAGLVAFGFWAALAAPLTLHAEVSLNARVDRDTLPVNEPFTLQVRLLGTLGQMPDFSVLEADFQILRRTQQSTVRVIGGEYVRETRWQLSLLARGEGRRRVPVIHAGAYRTRPMVVEVTAADDEAVAEDGFVEVQVSDPVPYVQSEIVYTVRLFRTAGMEGTRLSAPRARDGDALVRRLGEDRQYRAERRGRHYRVWERRYSVLPQRSGVMVLDPVTLEVRMDGVSSHWQTRRFRSRPLELRVQPMPPRPPGIPAGEWLPARAVSLQADWDADGAWTVGEPVSGTLTLTVDGQPAARLPALGLDAPDGIRAYSDRTQTEERAGDGGVVGLRRERVALLPIRGGGFELPPIELPWWNTVRGRWEVARLPARRLTVVEAPKADPATLSAAPDAQPRPAASDGGSLWRVVALVTAAGWLLTLALWWLESHRRFRRVPPRSDAPYRPSARAALRRVRQAARVHDALAARDALLVWAGVQWPDRSPRSLGAIASRLPPELARPVEALAAALYRDAGEPWQGGEALADVCGRLLKLPHRDVAQSRNEELASLWPR